MAAVDVDLALERPIGRDLQRAQPRLERPLRAGDGRRPASPVVQRAMAGAVARPAVATQLHRLAPVLGVELVAEHQRPPHRSAGALLHRHGGAGGGGATLDGVAGDVALEDGQLAQIRRAADPLRAEARLVEQPPVVGNVGVGVADQPGERARLERLQLVERAALGRLEVGQSPQRRAATQARLPRGVDHPRVKAAIGIHHATAVLPASRAADLLGRPPSIQRWCHRFSISTVHRRVLWSRRRPCGDRRSNSRQRRALQEAELGQAAVRAACPRPSRPACPRTARRPARGSPASGR